MTYKLTDTDRALLNDVQDLFQRICTGSIQSVSIGLIVSAHSIHANGSVQNNIRAFSNQRPYLSFRSGGGVVHQLEGALEEFDSYHAEPVKNIEADIAFYERKAAQLRTSLEEASQ